MNLETERLILRRWAKEDYAPFRSINADARVMEFYPRPLTGEESDRIITGAERHFEKHGFGLFAVESKHNNKLIGFVGIQRVPFESFFTPAIEIGWRIGAHYWNQGFATEAARAVIDDGFIRLKLCEIVAMVTPSNVKSQNVIQKLNMKLDSAVEFDHPLIDPVSPFRKNILYRLRSSEN